MALGRAVEVFQCATTLRTRREALGIDTDPRHLRQIDDHPAIAERMTGHAVPAPAHREQQLVVAGEAHRGDHVLVTVTPRHQRRAPVDHPVPELSCRLVARVPRPDEPPPQPRGELAHKRGRKASLPTAPPPLPAHRRAAAVAVPVAHAFSITPSGMRRHPASLRTVRLVAEGNGIRRWSDLARRTCAAWISRPQATGGRPPRPVGRWYAASQSPVPVLVSEIARKAARPDGTRPATRRDPTAVPAAAWWWPPAAWWGATRPEV
jgi:hypothetical protein